MRKLHPDDVRRVLHSLPRDVADAMFSRPEIVLAGGFIRAVIAGEEPADVDLLVSDDTDVSALAELIDNKAVHHSPNAISLNRDDILVQIVHRWRFSTAEAAIASLDFTVCQAAIYCDRLGVWQSVCCDSYYEDLAAKRLVYTTPDRDEDAGGSTLRLMKYARKGYYASPETVAAVITRMNAAATDPASPGEMGRLLREVDPAPVFHNIG